MKWAAWLPAFAGVTVLSSMLLAAPKSVQISTPDGIKLSAVVQLPSADKPLMVMLHGLDSAKEEWRPFMSQLEKSGWGYVAYDARRSGTPWQKWVDDQGAVIRYAEKAGVPRSKIFLAGASVGANVSLKYAALTGVGKRIVLLSPGLNYQGVTTEDSITKVTAPVLLVASHADAYAAASSSELKNLSKNAHLWMDVKPGHGTQMFDEKLLGRLMSWLESKK